MEYIFILLIVSTSFLGIYPVSSTISYAPGSPQPSNPDFTLVTDGNDATCLVNPGAGSPPVRMQMEVNETWTNQIAMFAISGHNLACHDHSSENLYLMALTSAQLSSKGVMKKCKVDSSTQDGTLESCDMICPCEKTCTHLYLVHIGQAHPTWDLCSLKLLGFGACAKPRCLNGATCQNVNLTYICNCVPGVTGIHCETDINECLSVPCQNGAVCNNNLNSYSCTCVPGYTGVQCETEIDECLSSPCATYVESCRDEVNQYSCLCKYGYTGPTCVATAIYGAELGALIVPGVRVIRGRDWTWANQDGGVGGMGTISGAYSHPPVNAIVEWDNGNIYMYYNGGGRYDLDLSGPQTALFLQVGKRVVRGTDWASGDEDGTPQYVGTVTGPIVGGLVPVTWDHGFSGDYRMGKDNKYDLKLAQPPAP